MARRYASPSPSGRPRYYFDTERGAFYSIPSRRFPRTHRLGVEELMTRQGTRTDFRVRANGDVYFRGVKVGHNVHQRTPPRLRSRERRILAPRPKPQPYYENIASLNPDYQLLSLKENNDGAIVGIYRDPSNGRTFTVKT
jgi:hypothetical protein